MTNPDFSDVYEKYFKQVYAYIYTLCGNKNIAEEITQETFFKALQKIDGFRGDCKISVWLCQIAKNTYITHQKKKKSLSINDVPEIPDNSNFLNDLEKNDSAFMIHKILREIDELYKEVFTLRVFGELSFEYISKLFNKSESWARVTFFRAKKKIQERMEEQSNE
ncbi:MAG: RNA polymerase sigma factor [Clostridiales bacterium]|nr:RNA polymerase sigma factor [Clostridiales bacterium]